MFGNEEYRFLDKLVIRTPFYSLGDYSADQLPEILADQAFRNAILLASPGLYRSIEKKGFRYDELGEKERLTLFKYYNRMSFRPTPFGAFASVSLAGWSTAGAIRLVSPGSAVLHLLPSLEATILNRATLPEHDTMLFVNPTMYRFGDTWRYIRSSATASGKLEFALQSIAADPLYDHLFSLTNSRAVSRQLLVDELMQFADCSRTQAANYATFLIREQALLTNEVPGMIEAAQSADRVLLTSAQKVPEPGFTYPQEVDGRRSMTPYYAGIERKLESGGVAPALQERLRSILALLARIVPDGRIQALADFRKAFKSRFDLQKVPLLTALDPDAGISYENLHTTPVGDLLLGGLKFRDHEAKEQVVGWTAVNRLFLRIWLQDDKRGTHDPVLIKDEELGSLPAKASSYSLPPSLAVLFSRSGGQLVLESAGGATATALVGRFSVFNEETARLSREIATAEIRENPDILFAEIHQRSNNHIDNINRRIQLYDHIIPLNVFPHVHEKGHILPSDLLVSVRNEEVVLESVSLGKRIIPRLPTAYNYQHNELALFRFLCDLQYQELQSNLTFDPERLFPGLRFYPRFTYRDCILSLAKWLFDQTQVSALLVKPFSLGLLHLFRQQQGIPRHISLTQGDQQLIFDLANDREAVFFLENIRELKTIVLREYLFPDGVLTAGKGSLYAGQYLAFLKKQRPVYTALKPEDPPAPEIERHFPPGSEWLHLSLYCTAISADRVMQKIVLPVATLSGPGICEWFFVRYHDPRPHLRVRIKASPEQTGRLLSAFKEKLSRYDRDSLVSEYKTETYCRELERYSTALISSVEDLFCAGTAVYMDRMAYQKDADGSELWPFVFIYAVINRFLSRRPDILSYLHWVKEHFLKEFKADKPLKRDLDNKYREISGQLTRLIEGSAGSLLVADVRVKQYLLKIDDLSAATQSWSVSKQENLLSDLVHMEVNRMFPFSQRQNETVLYYCLHKYESSRIAKEKAADKFTAGD